MKKEKVYCIYKIKKDINNKIISDNIIAEFDSLQEVSNFLGVKKNNLKSYISKKVLINNIFEVLKMEV